MVVVNLNHLKIKKMKKKKLTERLQQLAGIKPLYEIDSIEREHDFFPNRSVIQNRNNPELTYYMQSGKRRRIMTKEKAAAILISRECIHGRC